MYYLGVKQTFSLIGVFGNGVENLLFLYIFVFYMKIQKYVKYTVCYMLIMKND